MMSKGLRGEQNVTLFDNMFQDVDGGNKQQHNAYDADMANSFYNLATDFYEYGWGESFHFGFRREGEPHSRSILNSQAFLAQKLQVKDMDRVLDMGCGIGGPLRSIIRLTGANVTGVTINKHQVQRGREICSKLTPYMQKRCHFVVEDYLNVKGLEENTYDAAFYMESSIHTETRQNTFRETFRLLKPGGRLVGMEYCLLPGWDAKNPEHQKLMQMYLYGNGACKTPTIEEDLQMFREAGFDVVEHFDYMGRCEKLYGYECVPWWADLQLNWRFQLLPAHPWIRGALAVGLKFLSMIRLVPEDVYKASALLNIGGDGLSGMGKIGAITTQYYVLAVKPLNPPTKQPNVNVKH